jgi:hypothetical protein
MSLDDRILASLDKLAASAPARESLPDARYLACWSYTVTTANERTFSGRALSPRCPQPDLPAVPNMPGIPGTLLQPTVGSIVGVMFLDGDPAQPRAVTWDQTTPVSVGLAGGGEAVHRVNDLGTAGTIVLVGPPGAGTGFTIASADGTSITFSFAFTAGAVVVSATSLLPHTLVTKAVTGSTLVTCGG